MGSSTISAPRRRLRFTAVFIVLIIGLGLTALAVVATTTPCVSYEARVHVSPLAKLARLILPTAHACGGGSTGSSSSGNTNSSTTSNWCFAPTSANDYPFNDLYKFNGQYQHNGVYTTCFGPGDFVGCEAVGTHGPTSSGVDQIYGYDHCFVALPTDVVQKNQTVFYRDGVRQATITNPADSTKIFKANLIEVYNPNTGISLVMPILDTGPMCTLDDPYVLDPNASTIAYASDHDRGVDLSIIDGNPGCVSNLPPKYPNGHGNTTAGLDLSFQALKALGNTKDDALLKWRFVKP